jgi:hypothetical protein
MSSLSKGSAPCAPWPDEAHQAVRWICTNNPFYVVSAGLFLAGIWITFDPDKATDTWALMAALAGYTLLLAATAYLLVRHANVWDDARTVLLLVVLLFLATSVTFDRVLVFMPRHGAACNLVGLVFAAVVSEGVLRGIRLKLPSGFRGPYYLLLGLFFLYPVGLANLLNLRDPKSEAVMWGMFAFAPLAGLIFLTLLPAIWRGPDYVDDNGSPWPWPLYPWSLFGLLALAVPGRAILLCYSMHLIDVHDLYDMTFGPYFLVPFGLVLAVLLLEMGLKSNQQGVLWTALAIPVGLIVMSKIGHHSDPIYQEFLAIFTRRLGASPEYLALWGAAAFYGYAALRRVQAAVEALTAALLVLTILGSSSVQTHGLVPLKQAPLLLAAALQLGLGCWQRQSGRCLAGTLIGIASLAFIGDAGTLPLRWLLSFHLAVLAMLIIGAIFEDVFASCLRVAGPVLAMLSCMATMFTPFDRPPANLPEWAVSVYPLGLGMLLLAYGLYLKHYLTMAVAGLILSGWLTSFGWSGYCWCRELIAGLDYLALSLIVFVLAAAISLGKSGRVLRWFPPRERTSDASD